MGVPAACEPQSMRLGTPEKGPLKASRKIPPLPDIPVLRFSSFVYPQKNWILSAFLDSFGAQAELPLTGRS